MQYNEYIIPIYAHKLLTLFKSISIQLQDEFSPRNTSTYA